jgi:hypothetical protein
MALAGIREPQSVRDLICAAQLATRTTNPAPGASRN